VIGTTKARVNGALIDPLHLKGGNLNFELRGGVLALAPLNFGVAGGNLVSQIKMDARQPVIKTQADINVRQVRLEKLFPASPLPIVR
jgi:uncharacterized protein involved in outer membrane biogenesis